MRDEKAPGPLSAAEERLLSIYRQLPAEDREALKRQGRRMLRRASAEPANDPGEDD